MKRCLLLFLGLTACTSTGKDSASADTGPSTPDVNGSLETVDGRQVLKLWGTREEIGYAEGVLMCEYMPILFKDYVLGHLVADYGVPYDLVQPLVEMVIELPEGDERELQALFQGAMDTCSEDQLWVESEYLEEDADGARMLTYEDLLAANVLADYACSSVTAWGETSATGDTIHARNFDWAIDPGGTFLHQHLVKVYSSTEQGGAHFASVTVPGLIGCISCFTEEGVGLTMHNVTGLDATHSSGIHPRMLAARSALAATWGQSDPVTAAEAVLEAAPQRVGNNLHLSFPMATGVTQGGVVFEYDGKSDHEDGQATVRVAGEDPDLTTLDGIACTNHYEKRSEPPTSGDSWSRLDTLVKGLDTAAADGGLDADSALALIDSISNEYTAHSVVMDNANRELRVYVAPETGTPATQADPMLLDLDTLFDGLP